jgi:hypothetical protein
MGGEEARRRELEKTGKFPQGWSVKMCRRGRCRFFMPG